MNIDEMQAGRELDALIAEKVMKLPGVRKGDAKRYHAGTGYAHLESPNEYYCDPQEDYSSGRILRYSTDIAAAWQVVEMFHPKDGIETRCPKAVFYVTGLHDGTYRVDLTLRAGDNKNFGACADTVQLAICRAALKAVMGENASRNTIPGLPHAVFGGELDESGAPIYNVPFPMPDKGDEIE